MLHLNDCRSADLHIRLRLVLARIAQDFQLGIALNGVTRAPFLLYLPREDYPLIHYSLTFLTATPK